MYVCLELDVRCTFSFIFFILNFQNILDMGIVCVTLCYLNNQSQAITLPVVS